MNNTSAVGAGTRWGGMGLGVVVGADSLVEIDKPIRNRAGSGVTSEGMAGRIVRGVVRAGTRVTYKLHINQK